MRKGACMILEAVETPKPDELDRTGLRCPSSIPGIGLCHRRADHVALGDPWHHAMTDAKTGAADAQHWRWMDEA